MNAIHKRWILWGTILFLFVLGVVWLLLPRPVAVAIAQVEKGTFVMSVTDEGKTRIHDIYQVSAPVAGRLKRIDVEIGDYVLAARTVVAEIEPSEPTFLDARSKAQLGASLQTAESAMSLAQAELAQAEAELAFAEKEYQRVASLRTKQIATEREMDDAKRLWDSSQAALATARAALQMRQFQYEEIKASQLSPVNTNTPDRACECLDIYSPIDGLVMGVHNRSEGVVAPATPLLDIGNPNDLEVVVELLSTDAVQVEVGQAAYIRNWGGAGSLEAQVNQIEPIGFTKVSALGIEEQRVNVVLAFTGDHEKWSRLGHGYQVDVEIILTQQADQLLVPLTALVREQGHWSIYVVKDDTAHLTTLKVDAMNDQYAQVSAGINEAQRYIRYPSNKIKDGSKITELIK